MATKYRQRLAIALALIAGGAALAAPARAQTWNLFDPFFQRPQPVLEPTRPPPPRKVETPPTETIVVIGDSLADWLGYGLENTFADTPEVGIERKIKPYAGLIRYEARLDAPDWAQAVKDMLAAEKPSVVVVMLGLNDRIAIRERPPAKDKDKDKDKDKKGAAASAQGQAATPPAQPPAASPDGEQPAIAAPEPQRRSPNGYYEFHTDKWAELYEKRIDDMIAALKSKGVPVVWVGLPAIRGAKSTSEVSYLDELYRARADKAGISYVDIWDGFVDDKGNFTVQGPDFEGQIRRLRTWDGVNFTKAGAEKLAHYVEHELRRVIANHVIPVALPGPEEQAPPKGRPAIGAVVPLSANGGETGDLLGSGSHPAQREADPVATRVLSHGEAIAAPPGRADDFSWPRADANANGADVAPAPDISTPPRPTGKGAAGKGDANRSGAGKADTKKTSARSPLAPRPPLPVGPAKIQ